MTEIGLVGVETASHDTKPYVEAKVMPILNYELHDTPLVQLAGLVEAMAMVEGPVHRDEVVVRLRSAWGLMRAGGRIDGAVGHAIDFAMSGGKIQEDGQFLSIPGASVTLRDRSNVVSLTLRRPEMLPAAEIDAGVLAILSENFGATQEEAVQAISRGLGFKATSSQLRDLIVERLKSLTERGLVRQQGPVLLVGNADPAKPPTSSLAMTNKFEGDEEPGLPAVGEMQHP